MNCNFTRPISDLVYYEHLGFGPVSRCDVVQETQKGPVNFFEEC